MQPVTGNEITSKGSFELVLCVLPSSMLLHITSYNLQAQKVPPIHGNKQHPKYTNPETVMHEHKVSIQDSLHDEDSFTLSYLHTICVMALGCVQKAVTCYSYMSSQVE